MHHIVGLCRLHFHPGSEKPWCIDFGEGSEELCFKDVRLQDVVGVTGFTHTLDNNYSRREGWIMFEGVMMVDVDKDNSIATIRKLTWPII